MRGRSGFPVLGLGLGLLICVGAVRFVLPAGAYGDLPRDLTWRYIACTLSAGGVYLGAVAWVRRRAVPRWAVAAGLAAGLLARLITWAGPPILSTDLYRYIWDGRVQAAGISPYRYLPADPALDGLRDGGAGPGAIYANINRADTAPTIYPPAAQMLFAAIGWLSPTVWTVKAVMLLLDVAGGLAAWRLLRACGRPDAFLLVWAWNPLLIWEFAGAGHIDAAAAAASVLALLFAARGRPGWAGAALGVGVLCKLLPAALAPAIWRRPRDWRAPACALATVAAGYACYASAGWRVLGYLPGYAREEGLAGGGGFLLLRLLAKAGPLPAWAGTAYLAGCTLLLGGLAGAILLRPGANRADVIARQALLLAVALLVAISPHYPWYLSMVVLPATVVPRAGALWLSAAGPLLYQDYALGEAAWPAIVYLPALAWLLFELRKGVAHG